MLKAILKMAESMVNLSCLYTELNERVTKLEKERATVTEEAEENPTEAKFQRGLDSILNYSAGKGTNEEE